MNLDAARILITGGCGQIGIAIAQYLQTNHPSTNIFVLDIKTPSPTSPQYIENITYYAGDITDASTISRILGNVQPQIVFHTAGIVPSVAQRLGLNNEEGFMRVNVEGTRNVVDECRRVGSVRAFVFTSSADVVKGSSWVDLRGVDERWPIPGKFDGLYAKSKATAESHVLSTSSTSFPTTALRAHAVFSAHDTNILPLLLSAPRNVHMGSGKNLYDFTYAPNLAHAHVLAAINLLTIQPAEATNYYSAAGKPFFVTNAEPCYFRTFITAVWKADDAFEGNRDSGNSGYSSGGSVGIERPIKKGTSIPKNVAVPFVWMSEKVSKISGKKPMLTTKELGDSMAERFFDNTRAKEVFEYVPMVKLADAIRESVGGYKRIQKWEGRAGGDLGGNVNA